MVNNIFNKKNLNFIRNYQLINQMKILAIYNIIVLFCLAPPPSYDSLFGRMREAHKVSKGVFDFLKNIIVLLLGTSK